MVVEAIKFKDLLVSYVKSRPHLPLKDLLQSHIRNLTSKPKVHLCIVHPDLELFINFAFNSDNKTRICTTVRDYCIDGICSAYIVKHAILDNVDLFHRHTKYIDKEGKEQKKVECKYKLKMRLFEVLSYIDTKRLIPLRDIGKLYTLAQLGELVQPFITTSGLKKNQVHSLIVARGADIKSHCKRLRRHTSALQYNLITQMVISPDAVGKSQPLHKRKSSLSKSRSLLSVK